MKGRATVLVLALFLGSCTTWRPVPVARIAGLPTVNVGETPPADLDYVVFFPAGYDVPVRLRTTGSLFAAEREFESRVKLSRDLYLYRYWASHDRINWKPSHDLLAVQFGGGFDVSGVQATVKLDLR